MYCIVARDADEIKLKESFCLMQKKALIIRALLFHTNDDLKIKFIMTSKFSILGVMAGR